MESVYTLIGKRLKEAREENKKTLEEVGNRVGTHKSTIQRWEHGKTEKINTAIIEVLANYLNVDAGWLSGKNVPKYKTQEHIDNLGNIVVSIPLIGTVKAGYNYLVQENIIGYVEVAKDIVGNGSEFFALKIKGDSMQPVLYENDVVIVKKQDDCEDGQIAVVLINGDEATIKRVKKSSNGIWLQPFNNNYEPLVFTNDEIENIPVKIIGVVKQLQREF